MQKITNKIILPVEGFADAIIFATGVIALLALIGYPVEEWAVTGAVLYAAFWISREVVTRLALSASKSLLWYGERVLRKLMVAMADSPSSGDKPASVKVSLVAIILLLSAVIGLAFGAGGFAIIIIGLTPLPGYFPWIAWGLAAFGVTGLSLIFGLIALVFFTVDTLSAAVNPKFSQFHAVTREVDYGLRRHRLMPATPAVS